jgi:hypothetical protein
VNEHLTHAAEHAALDQFEDGIPEPCACLDCAEEREREADARRRNIALTMERDRADRARRGLPASPLDASLGAVVHDAALAVSGHTLPWPRSLPASTRLLDDALSREHQDAREAAIVNALLDRVIRGVRCG